MTNSKRLADARKRLCVWLNQCDVATGSENIVAESILIVDGFYCGRRFFSPNFFANWFLEEDELKIHAATGELLCVYVGDELRFQHQTDEPADIIAISDHHPEVHAERDDQDDQNDQVRHAA